VITPVSLTAERRLKLLLAKEYQFAIIEDDYDYDFQFEGLAMLPMASSDANGMVIYLGKGQSLPSFQTGFVVARKFNFRSQELFANAGPPRRFNTRTNAI
jgi:GntR family transcriptional regulator/MocR family aminotransferase